MKTILVVDDELLIVEIAAAILGQAGYRVLTAGDGKEALACLEKNKVDLVVLATYRIRAHATLR